MSQSTIERATMIKSRMEAHRLTSQWLMLHLARDHGVYVDKSTLSQILSGIRRCGDQPRAVLECSEKILDKYEAAFGA